MKSIESSLSSVTKLSVLISANNQVNYDNSGDTQQSGSQIVENVVNSIAENSIAQLAEVEGVRDILSDELKEDIERAVGNIHNVLKDHPDLFKEIISLCVNLGKERDGNYVYITDIENILQEYYKKPSDEVGFKSLSKDTYTLVNHLYFRSDLSKKNLEISDIISLKNEIRGYLYNYYNKINLEK